MQLRRSTYLEVLSLEEWNIRLMTLNNWGKILKFVNFLSLIRGCVSKRFRTGHLERELQMVQLSATTCSCIAILWISLVSFAAITLCVASQRMFVVVYFVIDSLRKLFVTPSYNKLTWTRGMWKYRVVHIIDINIEVHSTWNIILSNELYRFRYCVLSVRGRV
jgi:hypothetical protein